MLCRYKRLITTPVSVARQLRQGAANIHAMAMQPGAARESSAMAYPSTVTSGRSTLQTKHQPPPTSSQHTPNHSTDILSPLDSFRTLSADLTALDSQHTSTRSDLRLDLLWARYIRLQLQAPIISSQSHSTLILLIGLAGRRADVITLSKISHFLRSSPEYILPSDRVLHPDHKLDTKKEDWESGIVVQLTVAEVALGTTSWGKLIQSLRSVGLAPAEPIDSQRTQRLASRVVECWIGRRMDVALEVYRQMRREGVALDDRAGMELCSKAVERGNYEVALDVLGQGTLEEGSMVVTVNEFVRRLATDRTVTLPLKMAPSLARSMLAVAKVTSAEMPWKSDVRRYWEWCILALARSECQASSVNIVKALPSARWSSPFLKTLSIILCSTRCSTLASELLDTLPANTRARQTLARVILRWSSKHGPQTIASWAWEALRTSPGYTPAAQDTLLWQRSQAARSGRAGYLPRPITETNGGGEMSSGQHSTDGYGAPEGEHWPNTGSRAQHHLSARSFSHTFNGTLSSALNISRPQSISEVLAVCRDLLDKAGSRPSSTTSSAGKFGPDLVTLNILIRACLALDSVDVRSIQMLVDRIVGKGYPTAGLATQTSAGRGLVYGTRFFSKDTPWGFVDSIAKPGVLERLSPTRHALPLYKMIMKALYMRGDKPSARTMVYLYKNVRDQHQLRLERIVKGAGPVKEKQPSAQRRTKGLKSNSPES